MQERYLLNKRFMQFSELIIESREDDFKKKYSKKFSAQNLEKIVKSIAPKYLDWVGKVMDEINFDETFSKVVPTVTRFNNISTNLPQTDINQYNSFNELYDSITKYDSRIRRDVKQVKGGNVVYDDGVFFVVNPLNYESSCYYGKGTKWCTAAETDSHFKRYNEDGKLFYIIDRTKASNDPNYKIAMLKKFDGDVSFFDAKDDRVEAKNVFGEKKYNEIMSSTDEFLNEVYPEQVKIYADRATAKKEKERLENLRIQREQRLKREAAQERREEGEWSGRYEDMDDEGLRANALLNWIDSYESVEVMTSEDRAEITRLELEIDRLDQEYDNSEDPEPDLLDQKSELEDELEELRNKIDVYNIIRTGDFYSLGEFEVLESNLSDRRYAVGDEDDMQRSAYNYLDNLIDDIGFEGFNKGFAMGYLDNEAIADYAEEMYDYDVRESPESYFDEEEKQLSGEQQEEIQVKRLFIEKAENQISKMEDQMGGDNNDDIQEKIDELNELIEAYEEEITEIEENPDGEYPEDLIEDKVRSLVSDVRYDPEDFMESYGLEWDKFIDRDDFIQGVIDDDGYGQTLNGYDGSADEVKVGDKWFYVMRID
jgi:hypothetical protein